MGIRLFEKVYERALLRELDLRLIPADTQVTFSVVVGYGEGMDLG